MHIILTLGFIDLLEWDAGSSVNPKTSIKYNVIGGLTQKHGGRN